MKVLRRVLLCGAFVVGVFVSSANVAPVELVVWPNLGVSAATPAPSLELPLFVLVLISVLFGLALGGGGALFEQGRLRLGLRRYEKTTKRLKVEASAAAANMVTQREEVERLSRELDDARREIADLQDGSSADGDLDEGVEAARIAPAAGEQTRQEAGEGTKQDDSEDTQEVASD